MDTYRSIICDEAINLSIDDKKQVLKLLKRHCPGEIKKFSDGTRIVLNKVPDDVVKLLYDFIKHRLNLPTI